jgi:hypothetical protein
MVLDAADDGALDHVKGHDLGVGVAGFVLNLEANVFKILGIPKGLEIAPQRVCIVRVARPAENSGLQSFRADAAISVESDFSDSRSGLLWRRRRHTYLWLRRGRRHWRAGSDLGSQWQP